MPESVAALQRIRATVLDATPRRFEGLERLMPDLQAMAQEQERAADPATRRALQDPLEEAGRLVTLESLKQGRVVTPRAGLEVLSDPRVHERRAQLDRFLARTQEEERAKESRLQRGPVLLADRRTPDERIYDEQWNTIRSWHLSDGPEVQHEGELMTRRQFAVRSYILAQNAGLANMASNPLSAVVTFRADTTDEMIERANLAANIWAFAPALPGVARNLRNSVSPTTTALPPSRTLGRGLAAAPQTFDPETAIPAGPRRRPETPAPASGRAGSPWRPSPTNRRLILAPEGGGGGGAFVGQAPRPEARVEGGVERRAGPVFPAALPPTRAPGSPALPDSATSPWQDSWLNPAGLHGPPFLPEPTPVVPGMRPPPISLPPPVMPSLRRLPPPGPSEPIDEPERPEPIEAPASSPDTGLVGDPAPDPEAALHLAPSKQKRTWSVIGSEQAAANRSAAEQQKPGLDATNLDFTPLKAPSPPRNPMTSTAEAEAEARHWWPGHTGVETHSSASVVRESRGVTGAAFQSAHLLARTIGAAINRVLQASYSPGRAVATLLPPDAHQAFDRAWLEVWNTAVRNGTQMTLGEAYTMLEQALNAVPPNLIPPKVQGELTTALGKEFRDLGLPPDTVIIPPKKPTP